MSIKCAYIPFAFLLAGCVSSGIKIDETAVQTSLEKARGSTISASVEFEDRTRHFKLYLPERYIPGQQMPIVLYLHGSAGNADAAIKSSQMNLTADQHSFFVLYPEAEKPFPDKPDMVTNARVWNDGSGRAYSGKENIDDTAYLNHLLDAVQLIIPYDPDRLYAVGFSNGAAMSMRLALELYPRITAVGAVAGHLFVEPEIKELEYSIPLIFISGNMDYVAPPQGGRMKTPYGEEAVNPPVLETLNRWARINQCETSVKTLKLNWEMTLREIGPCPGKTSILYYLLNGVGHVWPGGVSLSPVEHVGPNTSKFHASSEIWNFLSIYAKKAAS
ncbi:MAG: hypothetical protein KDK41_17365 [Leptospiraceae bacterium]|nr:hypothetical protein [Leptospiraceae bacterium]